MPSRIKGTRWRIPPHTRAKLDILRFYLDAWFPIMATWNPRLVYLDGFAGPGSYLGGEDGSPIVALQAGLSRLTPLPARLTYLFIEERPKRAEYLRTRIEALGVGDRADVHIHRGTFAEAALDLVESALRPGGRAAPLFAFVDPFNWDIPFAVIRRLLAYPSAEVFVNFMLNPVQRFLASDQQAAQWDALFGTPEWRQIRDDPVAASRTQRITALYRQQLRTAGAKYVLSFDMRDAKGRTSYSLFFATKDAKGLEKMKEAMWRVDGTGRYFFRDPRHPHQPLLLEAEARPDYRLLRQSLEERFGGQTVPVEEAERFVLEETPFRAEHLRRPVLAPMEAESPSALTVVNPPSGRRRGTYPAGTLLHFPRQQRLWLDH